MNFTRAHTKHKETGKPTFLCTRLSLSVTTITTKIRLEKFFPFDLHTQLEIYQT